MRSREGKLQLATSSLKGSWVESIQLAACNTLRELFRLTWMSRPISTVSETAFCPTRGISRHSLGWTLFAGSIRIRACVFVSFRAHSSAEKNSWERFSGPPKTQYGSFSAHSGWYWQTKVGQSQANCCADTDIVPITYIGGFHKASNKESGVSSWKGVEVDFFLPGDRYEI